MYVLNSKKNLLQTGLLVTLFFAPPSQAASINSFGVSGLYNVPNADILKFGDFAFNYNNVLDGNNRRDQYTKGENINATLGIYHNLEVNLRLLHYYSSKEHQENIYGDFYTRDLSGNVKFQLPYLSSENLRFALGATDVAGLAVNFRRFYAVSSYKVNAFDFTLGYSHIPEGQRNNGVLTGGFAGLSYQPKTWLRLNLEKESAGQRAGSSLIWKNPLGLAGDIHFDYLFYNSHPQEPRAFNLGVIWPIGGRAPAADKFSALTTPKIKQVSSSSHKPSTTHLTLPQIINKDLFSRVQANKSSKASQVNELEPVQVSHELLTHQAEALREALETAGLDRIQIGNDGNTILRVVYENRLHNWSQTLALGAVLNALASSALLEHYEATEIYTLNKGMVLLKTTVSKNTLLELNSNPNSYSPSKLKPRIQFKTANRLPNTNWFFDARTNEKLDVTLTLAYRAYYGTEWNNWDYSVALRPVFNLPLWKGAHISNVYHLGTQNTFNFKQGEVFASKAFEDQMNELMIHQTLHPLPSLVNTLSYGELKLGSHSFKGFMNQGSYHLFEGYGRFYWRQGEMKSSKLNTKLDYNALGLEANLPQLNLTFGAQTGSYIEGDKSNIYYSRVRLGNATLGLALTQSDITWERIDMSIMFPLGPRKNIALGPVTLGGDPLWYTGIGTVTDNPIAPNMNLIDINPGYKLVGAALGNSHNQFIQIFDNGRLTPAYLKNNLNQLLDAIDLAK